MGSILVTGGAGFIGSHLVDALVKMHENVTIIDDFSGGREENLYDSKHKIKLLRKSICDDLDLIFREGKFDCVFHLAALPRVQFSIENPEKTHNVNVNGTINLLENCRKHNVRRFVFSSSSSVYGDQDTLPFNETMKPNPMSPYALHKLIGEQYCKLYSFIYGLETVSLRYFNVYGTRQDPRGAYALVIAKFTKMFREGKTPIINGDGNQTRDFTHVNDVVRANILAYKTKNKECFGNYFNVGFGKDYSINFVTEQIGKILNSDLQPEHGSSVIEPRHTKSDVYKAKRLLDWEPKVRFEEGLRETVLNIRD